MSIRFKIILPYLLLTLIVSITGAYVVTRLVTASLAERLNNQLFEAGRAVSDNFVQQERQQAEIARVIISTQEVGESLQNSNHSKMSGLVLPVADRLGIEDLFIVDMQNQEMLHLLRQEDGMVVDVTNPEQENAWEFVQPILAGKNPNSPPTGSISKELANSNWYHFTVVPFVVDNNMIGVIGIGTSVDTILPLLKKTTLADVIIYGEDGQAIATTLQSQGEANAVSLQKLSIPVKTYQEIATAETLVLGENLSVGEHSYKIARGKLQAGAGLANVFAVALPIDYVVQASATSRNNYIILYTLTMFSVIGIGYFVARLIINPVYKLIITSRAIESGDLTKRTEIKSRDEIGVLANTFDTMTEKLQQRTIELEETNRILEQMDRTRSHFIITVGHELRTPLTLNKGYLQMLESVVKENIEASKYVHVLLENSERLDNLVDNFLDMSRIDTKTLDLVKAELQIGFVLQKVYKEFEEVFTERNIQLNSADEINSLPILLADSELIHKVFYNIISNAIKYTPDGGSIYVTGRIISNNNAPTEVEISVRDTGIGIDANDLELIFEKFYQTGEVLLHSSGKAKFRGGGPGLGLAIVRGIVEVHGGQVWAESLGYDEEKFPGSTFYVRLPITVEKN